MGTNSTNGDGWPSLHPARRPPSRSTPHHHTPAGRPRRVRSSLSHATLIASAAMAPCPRACATPRPARREPRTLLVRAGRRVIRFFRSPSLPGSRGGKGEKKVLFSVQSCRLPPPPRRRRLRPRTACHHPWSGVGVLPVCRTHRRTTYVYVCCPSVTVDVSVSHHSLGTEEYTLFSFFRKKERELLGERRV
jgi:hypothetical protein